MQDYYPPSSALCPHGEGKEGKEDFVNNPAQVERLCYSQPQDLQSTSLTIAVAHRITNNLFFSQHPCGKRPFIAIYFVLEKQDMDFPRDTHTSS